MDDKDNIKIFENKEKWYISIIDVIVILTQSDRP